MQEFQLICTLLPTGPRESAAETEPGNPKPKPAKFDAVSPKPWPSSHHSLSFPNKKSQHTKTRTNLVGVLRFLHRGAARGGDRLALFPGVDLGAFGGGFRKIGLFRSGMRIWGFESVFFFGFLGVACLWDCGPGVCLGVRVFLESLEPRSFKFGL